MQTVDTKAQEASRGEEQAPVTRIEIGRAEIERAAELIAPWTRRTPVLAVRGDDLGLPWPEPLWCKLELLQASGSFKARGAFLNLLTRDIPAAGVVAASGGNHGVAVAYASSKLGIPAVIFVPSVAAPRKLDSIRASGARLEIAGDRYADALAASIEYAGRTGALQIHAFDQRETVMGQATVGLELEQQVRLETLLVPVGGSGLIAGIAAWYAGRVKIVAVEPEDAPTLARALEAGEPVDAPDGSIAADALAPRRVGVVPFDIIRRFVDRVVFVNDDDMREAQRTLRRATNLVAEPAGGAALAALLSGRYVPRAGERVGVIVSGGNVSAIEG